VYLLIYLGLAVVMMFVPFFNVSVINYSLHQTRSLLEDTLYYNNLFPIFSFHYLEKQYILNLITLISPFIVTILSYFLKAKPLKLLILTLTFVPYLILNIYIIWIWSYSDTVIHFLGFAFYFSIFLTLWSIFSLIVYKRMDSLPLKPPRPHKPTKGERIAALEEEIKQLKANG
jgi:hypothetical protein